MEILEKLPLTNTQAIQSLLHQSPDIISIYAPAAGIALFPETTDNDKKTLQNSMIVKKDQALLSIGDLSSFSVVINVNELHINLLKVKQSATITSSAFPHYTLHGMITNLDYQAKQGDNGIPVFTARITVPNITDEQRSTIHVGMSARIAINIESPKQIYIPLDAVIEKNGRTYVQLMNKEGSLTLHPVTPGITTENTVVIMHGIKRWRSHCRPLSHSKISLKHTVPAPYLIVLTLLLTQASSSRSWALPVQENQR